MMYLNYNKNHVHILCGQYIQYTKQVHVCGYDCIWMGKTHNIDGRGGGGGHVFERTGASVSRREGEGEDERMRPRGRCERGHMGIWARRGDVEEDMRCEGMGRGQHMGEGIWER